MSKEHKQELTRQVISLIAKAGMEPALMFNCAAPQESVDAAASNLDNILSLLGQYAETLSVPQAIANSRHLGLEPELISALHLEIAYEADACEPAGLRRDGEASLMREFDCRSLAHQAEVFRLPQGMEPGDIDEVCRDLDTLLDSYHLSLEPFYQQTANTHEGRIGFYTASRWVQNAVEFIGSQSRNNVVHVMPEDVDKVGPRQLKPAGLMLN